MIYRERRSVCVEELVSLGLLLTVFDGLVDAMVLLFCCCLSGLQTAVPVAVGLLVLHCHNPNRQLRKRDKN